MKILCLACVFCGIAFRSFAAEPPSIPWGFDVSMIFCTSDSDMLTADERNSVSRAGFTHANIIEETMYVLASGIYCKWDLSKLAFVNSHKTEYASQMVGDYVIYTSLWSKAGRYEIMRSRFAVDTADDRVQEGAILAPGIYRFVRIATFEKGNGFPVDVPILELVPSAKLTAAPVVAAPQE